MLNLLLLPARLAFMEDLWAFWSFFVVFDYSSDLCYVLDIILRRRYLVLYERQGPVYAREEIATHYTEQGHFYLHMLAVIPLDVILLLGGEALVFPGLSLQQAMAVYRLNKLLRCVDLSAHSALVEERLSVFFSSSLKLTLRVCKLIFAVVISAHIFGCIFFIVGNQQHLRGSENNWADDAGILRNCSLGSHGARDRYRHECDDSPSMQELMTQYVFSIYWATATLTTVGFGDISAVSSLEQTFAMVVFLVGTAAYTVIVTNLEDIVSHLDVTNDIFKNRQARLQNFLQREQVPEDYFRRNAQHQDKLWVMQKGAQGHEIKEFLPANVYADIVTSTMKHKMSTIFFLKHQGSDFLADLAARLVLQVYLRGDTIFQTGEAASLLYLICSGEVAMVSEASGQQYAKLFAGEGERLGSTGESRWESSSSSSSCGGGHVHTYMSCTCTQLLLLSRLGYKTSSMTLLKSYLPLSYDVFSRPLIAYLLFCIVGYASTPFHRVFPPTNLQVHRPSSLRCHPLRSEFCPLLGGGGASSPRGHLHAAAPDARSMGRRSGGWR